VALEPHVGPAVAPAGLAGALLEGVDVAGVVGVQRFGDAEELTEIVEAGLRAGALFEMGGTDSFLLEGDGVHACSVAIRYRLRVLRRL
jgi:hypothetical protein